MSTKMWPAGVTLISYLLHHGSHTPRSGNRSDHREADFLKLNNSTSAGYSRQVRISPPWPNVMLPGNTFSRQGSSRRAANVSDFGLSHPGMIVGLYPSGSGSLRNRFHTMVR